jgi:predicted transcriptional regulator
MGSLVYWMGKHKIGVTELARASQVTLPTVYNAMQGKSLRISTKRKIAEGFNAWLIEQGKSGISYDEIFGVDSHA